MSADDPFGLENDAGRTRIRPVRRNAGTAAPPQAPASSAPVRTSRASDNPLLNAFAALIGLAPELERATAPENPDILRTRLHDTLTQSRDAAVSAGVPLSRADQGAWFVAALLDDIALNTPWGGNSGWPRMPLLVAMYGNVDAGERFYDLAEDLIRFPERDPELLELVFLCLSLGFRGKYRRDGGQGEAAIARLRGQMSRLLRDRDAAKAPLAPHWKGVEAADEKKRFIVPLWSIALLALALVTVIYVGLGIKLSNRGEQLYTLAGVLPPPVRAEIYRPVIETAETPLLTAEPFVFELLPLFAAAVPEGKGAALTGREDVSIAVIVVQSTTPEVFRSAKADLNPEYTALIESIAGVIVENAEFIGSVRVVGHTDSIQVRTSNPFRSNQGLSEARAATIVEILVAAGVPAELVTSEGKAATDPIADNGTREGRARNRRVEIIVQKKV
ncbi:type IVB secretion system protein IcmH/DotU [Pseudosulfitobacter sp. DSM 107133]|uniref:type IVB secretion system protein IcmH/DotU n=1 Tax=Pseudosulfitobacter sp. DSM 107133 TaxID=2883100 RepID=UPI000DF389E5|nr:type IVB secretion system protein IcmH/DotU [Pseudosulfitobacter sp. DSM 107133]UOA28981.1 putative lipoprotein YiaD [Pseudosulfitobacter sp. DSM 107133]